MNRSYYRFSKSQFIMVDENKNYCLAVDTSDQFLRIQKHSIGFFNKLDEEKLETISKKDFDYTFNKAILKINDLYEIAL